MSVNIDISKIRNNVGAKEAFCFFLQPDLFDGLEWEIQPDFLLKGSVQNMDGYLLLQAQAKGELVSSCARCLEKVSYFVDMEIHEKLLYISDTKRFQNMAFGELEEEYTIYDGDIFDFSDLLRENILAQLPMRVLCKEDCLGLCPHCGHNRNDGECHCETVEIDPRLAILAKLTETEEV